jgi:hypothetical protein
MFFIISETRASRLTHIHIRANKYRKKEKKKKKEAPAGNSEDRERSIKSYEIH